MAFSQQEHYLTGVKEQSSLAFVSSAAGFITVSDEKGRVYSIKPQPNGEAVVILLAQSRDLKGMEGVCLDRSGNGLLVLSEKTAKLWQLKLSGQTGLPELGKPVLIKKLESVATKNNKGYEGLALLAAELSPDGREWLLAVQEGKPRKVVFFNPATLELDGMAKIPDGAKRALPDLSDLTVSPAGTLFILSDRGNAFAEFTIQKHNDHDWELDLLGVKAIDLEHLPLGDAPRLQPEGICFDEHRDLWVACEGNTLLIRFTPG
jgi:uncharacterized protein YjiK